ncbi:MAG: DUF3572 domain-containing protein [Phyllobacteriaceae bacterium]|nr:DUF3572 domain-containing protein [Phyllobacteriaceae bacterium]
MKLLAYMAANEDLLGRFMGLSGLSPDDLRQGIADPAFQAGVLDFALSDESLLLAFAANAGLDPASLMQARSKMPGFAP